MPRGPDALETGRTCPSHCWSSLLRSPRLFPVHHEDPAVLADLDHHIPPPPQTNPPPLGWAGGARRMRACDHGQRAQVVVLSTSSRARAEEFARGEAAVALTPSPDDGFGEAAGGFFTGTRRRRYTVPGRQDDLAAGPSIPRLLLHPMPACAVRGCPPTTTASASGWCVGPPARIRLRSDVAVRGEAGVTSAHAAAPAAASRDALNEWMGSLDRARLRDTGHRKLLSPDEALTRGRNHAGA